MKFIREARLVIRLRNDDFTDFREPPIILNGLRVSFSIQKSLAYSANTAIIKVWNLSQNHRNELFNYGDSVTLYAGYERGNGLELLFVGDTTNVSHIFDPPEIISTFECADGDRFINNVNVVVSEAAGTPALLVLQQIAKQMGIIYNNHPAVDNLVYPYCFSNIGNCKFALNKVCDYLGLQWSVQNGQLQVIPQQGVLPGTPIEINRSTGMQGIPQRFTYRKVYAQSSVDRPRTGYRVNVALLPSILPGNSITLTSEYLGIKGLFAVENVRHEGDTYGAIWSSQLEVNQLIGNTTTGTTNA